MGKQFWKPLTINSVNQGAKQGSVTAVKWGSWGVLEGFPEEAAAA